MDKKINDLSVYNTLGKRLERFIPANDDFIGIYNCGPTLHKDHTQIGNLRSYVFADFVKRYFLYRGFAVRHVIKITDVDDHTLCECREKKLSLDEYTKPQLDDFLSQLEQMNIRDFVILPRVTGNIPEIVDAIKKLTAAGLTYSANGSTYFKVGGVENYGKLANLDKQASFKRNAQKRLKDFVSDDKEDINDFCLWKAFRPEFDGDVFWDSEFGKGRPGWHIECAVISQKYLGENFDIHVGGISHIFPHHTNEIAIAESLSGKKFVNYWLHHDYVVVDGEKMSKEKGTYLTLNDIVLKNYSPLVLRLVLLRTHYRHKLNFTWNSMDDGKRILTKLVKFLNSLRFVKRDDDNTLQVDSILSEAKKDFFRSMNSDFNISNVLRSLSDLVKSMSADVDIINRQQAERIRDFIFEVDSVLGCIKPLYDSYEKEVDLIIRNGLSEVLNKRSAARKEKKYSLADDLKKQIEDAGLIVKDQDGSHYFFCELKEYKYLF
jgi:cysteinyl-tRNA synthetase